MIQCPNCGEEIADNSAHCGFCGEKIVQGSGKQTMIGMAAVTADDMAQVARETREAREAAEEGDAGLGNERSKPAGLSIPKPAGGASSPPSRPSSSGLAAKLNIPKPGQTAPAGDSDTGGDAPPDAKTEVMNAIRPGMDASQLPIGGTSNTEPPSPAIDEAGPTDPMGNGAFGTPQTPTATNNPGSSQEGSGFGASPPSDDGFGGPTDSGLGNTPADDGFAAPSQQGFGGTPPPSGFGGPSTLGEETMKEVDPAGTGVRVPESNAGPSEFGNQPMTVQENTLPAKKSNKKSVLIVAGVGAFMMFCCIASTIFYNIIWPLL